MEIEKIYILPIWGVWPGSGAADLGFVRETLIFQTWNLKIPIGHKYVPLQGEISNVPLF